MKKSLVTIALMLFVVAAQAQITYSLSINQNRVSTNTISAPDGNNYSVVLLQGSSGNTFEAGNPQLPVQTIHLMIPFGKSVTNVVCSNVVKQSIQVNNWVYPAESYDSIRPVFVSPNTAVYNSNNVYPSSPIIAHSQGYFDGNNNIVSIDLCPFEYYPASGQLKQIVSATLTVNYTDGFSGGLQNIRRLQRTQNMYDSLLYHRVDNPEVIPQFKIAPTIVEDLGYTNTNLPVYEYVVIVPSAFENHSDLKMFIDWKRQKGYRAGLVTVEEILQNYPDGDLIGTNPIQDDAGSLRQYLHDAYELGTMYALLIGDPNCSPNTHRYIPFRYGCSVNNPSPDVYYLTISTTDWYYSDLTGDWNRDLDTKYGEPRDDAPSRDPNIAVGRILCFSDQELSNWVNKVLLYEKNPGNGNSNYVVNSLITRADGVGSSLYSDYLTHYYHTSLDEQPSFHDPHPYYPKGSDIINELNGHSYGLMTWFNHGGTNYQHSGMVAMSAHDGSSSNYDMWKLYSDSNCVDNGANVQPDSNNSLDCLINYNKPFIIYAASCNITPFNHTISNSFNQSRNCGESFTVGGMYGGVAFLGNTADAWGDYYNMFAMALDSAYNNEILSHLSILENQSKHDVSSNEWPHYHYKHNLIGDPECQIWTKIPTSMDVDVQSTNMVSYVKGNVRVSLENLVRGEQVTVALYSEDDIFQVRQITIGNENYVLFDSVFPVTVNPISVTVTCHNHLPYQIWIPVTRTCQIDVSTNETWLYNIDVTCDIFVRSNATLTIRGNVGFNSNCKIVVEPGGKLVIDGGKLYCFVPENQWQGIRVLGTGGIGYQGMSSGQYQQGYVSLMNNAQINDARVALDAWDGIHLNTTGGIVVAKDALFSNNGMVFRALYFKNVFHNPNNNNTYLYDYNAHFENCDFGIDEDYPTLGEVFRHHVELAKVSGVKFDGCNFHIQDCPQNLFADDNSAIYAFDAGFKVNRYCNHDTKPCPSNSYINSYFQGFNMGINSINSNGESSSITVQNAYFQNNVFGIRTLNDVGLTVLFSDFIVGENGTCGAGIYLEHTPAFYIEENTFAKAANATSGIDYFGIVASNTNGVNEIYRNTFNNLTCANFAIGGNMVSVEGGLSYVCNENNGNLIDFCIPTHTLGTNGYNIQLFQGSSSVAAGNTFSQNGVQWQFHNGGDDYVTYYYNSSNPLEVPQDAYTYEIRKFVANGSNDCLPHYTNGGSTPKLSQIERLQKESDYYTAYANYYSLKGLYMNYLDGGNTSDELYDIHTATPSDMWELRAQLLGHSPYLSNEVLRATADRDDIFTESVLFEILAANPEELGRDTLLNYLENNGTLPEYIMGILRNLASGTSSPRSVLESSMTYYKQEYSRAANDIIRSIKNDSIMNGFSDLHTWLGNLEDINADRQLIALYLKEGNENTAFTLANMLPSLYGLTGSALLEHNGYMKLLVLSDTLSRQGRTVLDLTETESAMVDSLFTYGIGIAQSMAKGLKEVRSNTTSLNCPEIMLYERGRNLGGSPITQNEINNALGLSVSISPNPATTWTAIDFTLPNKATSATLTLTNTLGVVVQNTTLNGNSGQKVLDLRNLPNGVYVLTTKCGELTQTGKIIIAK